MTEALTNQAAGSRPLSESHSGPRVVEVGGWLWWTPHVLDGLELEDGTCVGFSHRCAVLTSSGTTDTRNNHRFLQCSSSSVSPNGVALRVVPNMFISSHCRRPGDLLLRHVLGSQQRPGSAPGETTATDSLTVWMKVAGGDQLAPTC